MEEILNFIPSEQNAGEGPGLQSGLSGVPGSGKFYFLSELFGFKKPGPSAPRSGFGKETMMAYGRFDSCIRWKILCLTIFCLLFAFLPSSYAKKWSQAEISGIFVGHVLKNISSYVKGKGKPSYAFALRRSVQSGGDITLEVTFRKTTIDARITGARLFDLGALTAPPTEVASPKGKSHSAPLQIGHYYLVTAKQMVTVMQVLDLKSSSRKTVRHGYWTGSHDSAECTLCFRFVEPGRSIKELNAQLTGVPGKKTSIDQPNSHMCINDTPSIRSHKAGKRWAVVVGISDYSDPRIPSLRYAAADAKAFNAWAVSPKYGKYAPIRVKLLVNSEATGKNIKNALFVWLRQALEEDMVTIYFAGHGSPDSPDTPNNLFLLPYDVQYDNITTTGFPMWDIETALKRFIKAKKVVVIADSCHSGGIGHSFDIARRSKRSIQINPISQGIQNLSCVEDGICIISATSDKQFSQESQKWGGGHGVFTYFLLRGLNGKADFNSDSSITLGELTSYLSEKVRRETRNAQSPTVSGRYDPALTIGK